MTKRTNKEKITLAVLASSMVVSGVVATDMGKSDVKAEETEVVTIVLANGQTVEVTDSTDITQYFTDETLKGRILGQHNSDGNANVITFGEVKNVTEVSLNTVTRSRIANLNGLEFFVGLEKVNFGSSLVSSIKPLENLVNVTEIDINTSQGNLEDISALAKLVNLKTLNLSDNNITDISVLKDLPNLEFINLSDNNISDISHLTGKTTIKDLRLAGNNIEDLTAIKSLSASYLDLGRNNISDLSPLAVTDGINLIETLLLNNNKISNIDVLTDYSNLRALDLNNNLITDVTAISNLTNLKSLNLESNTLASIDVLSGLTSLTELNLANTTIEDITPITRLLNLQVLDLGVNKISDIRDLRDLTELTSLKLDSNVITNIESLKDLTKLKTLDITNNKVISLSPLSSITGLENLTASNNLISTLLDINSLNLKTLNISKNIIDFRLENASYSANLRNKVITNGENYTQYGLNFEIAGGTLFKSKHHIYNDVEETHDMVGQEISPVIVLNTFQQDLNILASTARNSDKLFQSITYDKITFDGVNAMNLADGESIIMPDDSYAEVAFSGTFNISGVASELRTGDYLVSYRDNIAPDAPILEPDNTELTNQNVTVTIEYSDDSVVRQYGFSGNTDRNGNQIWTNYTAPIVVSQNMTVIARGLDEPNIVANSSDISSLVIDNIDKVAPVVTAVSDKTGYVNTDVTVTATFTDNVEIGKKEYSLDGGTTWLEYTDSGVVMSENGVIQFKGTDTAGNEKVISHNVTNIDKVAPTDPVITLNNTAPTNKTVRATTTYSADSVTKEVSYDEGVTWTKLANNTFTTYRDFTTNGEVWARAVDRAGNVSNIVKAQITNIDKLAPDAPTFHPDITELTNQNVTVGVEYSDDSHTKQYSLNGSSWLLYTNSIVFEKNGTLYARGIDEAGNISEVVNYVVSNIDKIAPTTPTFTASSLVPTQDDVTVKINYSADSETKFYSLDKGETWLDYTEGQEFVFDENGEIWAKSADLIGNMSEVGVHVVNVIDREAPDAPVLTPDITEKTNKPVTVTAVYPDDANEKVYSLDDGKTWLNYTKGVVFTENGEILAKSVDKAKNESEVVKYVVDNIFTDAPTAPVITADITEPTNKDVTVTVEFSDEEDVELNQVSLDGGKTWVDYTESLVFEQNGTVQARSIDDVGNISKVTIYQVTNIDKIPPNAPTATADITAPTNKNVTVTPAYSSDSAVKEFSRDGGTNWVSYSAPFKFEENGEVLLRAFDAVGNASEVTKVEVTNIIKDAPIAPKITADITEPTNTDVVVTIEYSENSDKKMYSLDNGVTWSTYTTPLTFTANGKVLAKGIDIATNESEITEYVVDNIDKIPPELPVVSVSNTAPTNQDVIVTTTFSDDSTQKLYSLDNGETWLDYKGDIVFEQNGSVQFKAVDHVGNTTEIVVTDITNIDKDAPNAPIIDVSNTAPTNEDVILTVTFTEDSDQKLYSLDNGETWLEYTEALVFEQNGKLMVKALDSVGNVSEQAEYDVTNIDKVAPELPVMTADITEPTNTNVVVSIEYTEDSTQRLASLDGETWFEYTEGIVFEENGKVFSKAIDHVGNETEVVEYVVDNIDKIPPNNPAVEADITEWTNKDVHLTGYYSEDSTQKLYSFDDGETWLEYTEPVKVEQNGLVKFKAIDHVGNESEVIEYEVTNIDKTPPEVPVIDASEIEATNQDVEVFLTYSEDSTEKLYSLDEGLTWISHEELEGILTYGVIFEENGLIHAKAIDHVGNESEVAIYDVNNIKKTLPEVPTFEADVTTITNGDVIVSILYSEDSEFKFYSLDGGETWEYYSEGIKFTENGTVLAMGKDKEDNFSPEGMFEVTNIDKIAPDAPVATSDITEITTTDVKVSVEFSEDSVQKLVSLDGETYVEYTGEVTFEENGVLYSKGVDEAGNESEVTAHEVTNIDKIAPDAPVATSDITEITNTDVKVTVEFSEDSVQKLVSLDGETYVEYTGEVTFEENGVLYSKGVDKAGNESEVTVHEVANIDKIAPDAPVISSDNTEPTNKPVNLTVEYADEEGITNLYSIDGEVFVDYEEAVEYATNGKLFAKSIDEAGNESEVTEFEVTNIDMSPPEAPTFEAETESLVEELDVEIFYSEDSIEKLYSLDNGETWLEYTGKVTVDENITILAKGIDEAGNESEVSEFEVENIGLITETPVVEVPEPVVPEPEVIIVEKEVIVEKPVDLPQTGMDNSSSTTGGLMAMMLGLLMAFGIKRRKDNESETK